MKIVNILACEEGGPGSLLFISTPVKAGFPSPAADYMEERIDLNEEFIKHPLSTFLVNCEGDSMVNAFIPPRATLVVDRSLQAKNGDIILAVLNGEFTVKYLQREGENYWLVPANSKYPKINVTDEMHFQVWGVVTTIFSVVKDLPKCMH